MADIVYVVGLGPGDPQFLTAQAQSALEEAEVLCGYPVYLDLVRPYYPEKEYYATGMTKELDRCRWALETAHSGRTPEKHKSINYENVAIPEVHIPKKKP